MKQRNYSVLTIIIVFVLCGAVLVGYGQKVTQPSETTSLATPETTSTTTAKTTSTSAAEITTAETANSINSGVLLLKVNPEIAISYDEAGLVTDIAGRNPEGITIVKSYSNYAGKDCRTVISELVVTIANAGYFIDSVDSKHRTIRIELENGSGMPNDSFLDNIVAEVENKVAENHWNGTVKLDNTALNADTTTLSPYAETAITDIGADEAQNIALNHAGVTALAVTFFKTEKDYDDDHWVYEIAFYSQDKEYDYEIDALTGSILSYDYDVEYYAKPTSTPEVETTTPTDINVNKAKSIALKHAGLAASAVTFTQIEKDYDDGLSVYKVEFYVQDKEYDYEIDALTGAILSYDYDVEYRTKPSANVDNRTNYIGLEKAKTIALNHAGLSASDVSFSKAKFEDDDEDSEYEVQFYYNDIEYEYSIDASSGNIIEYDCERDD